MNETIKRILELQPLHTPENTPPMQQRGLLVRHELIGEIRAIAEPLREALGRFGDDFHVEASDGKGLKRELPWLRFCFKRMSPGPRQGFCGVIHFSRDGSAAHVTVGYGASS